MFAVPFLSLPPSAPPRTASAPVSTPPPVHSLRLKSLSLPPSTLASCSLPTLDLTLSRMPSGAEFTLIHGRGPSWVESSVRMDFFHTLLDLLRPSETYLLDALAQQAILRPLFDVLMHVVKGPQIGAF
ncbi:hypothetical protein B0H15DRAFT_942129 [Mycena belliarum]|uniref:Uncharacterized protein n=1 Tax=Mycena belliarum TaxID=1033014 RepID=A0AAD6UIG7_9AGAR|nr:hypothetical protein B0H15DRAFT_942129 [Mycena belliae]